MNIFFVDVALYKMGGVERVISTLANHMVDKYNVNVCSLYRHCETPFYEYDKRIKLDYLVDLSKAKSAGSKTKIGFCFFRFFEKIFESFYVKRRICNFCRKILSKCDIVIFGRTNTAVLFLPYMEQFKGKIIVRDAAHFYNISASGKRSIKKYFPRLVSTFIVSSEESVKLYTDFFGQSFTNIKKMYNPLGIIPKIDNCLKYKRVIGVGRYNHEKGFTNLLLAFANVHCKHPDWRLSLIGDGEEYKHYVNMCKKLGIFDYIEFKKSANIVEEYCKSGIFVMTSRHEGYANALVEAMACGLPVVSYDWYVGVDDIIQDRQNGIIVHLQNRERYFKSGYIDSKDVNNLADTINELIENTELRNTISCNATNIVESRAVENIVEQWVKIIEEE